MSEQERIERSLRQIESLLECLISLLEERLPRPTYFQATGGSVTVRS
jgi:hypothetical protein